MKEYDISIIAACIAAISIVIVLVKAIWDDIRADK